MYKPTGNLRYKRVGKDRVLQQEIDIYTQFGDYYSTVWINVETVGEM